MAIINFSEYINQLKQKASDLKSLVKSLDGSKSEILAKFQIQKNQIQKEVSGELKEYSPAPLGLEMPSSININLKEEDFFSILNKIYKIN